MTYKKTKGRVKNKSFFMRPFVHEYNTRLNTQNTDTRFKY